MRIRKGFLPVLLTLCGALIFAAITVLAEWLEDTEIAHLSGHGVDPLLLIFSLPEMPTLFYYQLKATADPTHFPAKMDIERTAVLANMTFGCFVGGLAGVLVSLDKRISPISR